MSERNILPPFSRYVTSYILNMETPHSTKTTGAINCITWCHIPEDPTLSIYGCENLKSHFTELPTLNTKGRYTIMFLLESVQQHLFRSSVLSKWWQHLLICSHFISGTCTELTVTYVSYYHICYIGSNNKYLIFLSMHLNVYEHVLFTEVWWLQGKDCFVPLSFSFN